MTVAHWLWDEPGLEAGWMEVAWALSQIVFWVLVGFVVIRLLGSRGHHRSGRRSSALSVLEERYARGEVTREEFLERREVLLRGNATSSRPASREGPTQQL